MGFLVAALKVVASVFTKVIVIGGVKVAVGKILLNLAISAAIVGVMRALSPKPPGGSIDQGQELDLKFDPAYPREVAIGRFSTGGSLAYAQTSGANNENLWRVIVISDNQIEAVDEIWANGEKLTFSGDWHAGYVNCTSHFRDAGGTPKLSVRIYKGTEAQTADATLVAATPEWTTNCRGRGIAYAIVKKIYNADAFQGGEPTLVFVGRGAVKVWDPRIAGQQYTANAALLAAQAMRGFSINGVRVVGLGATAADVPDDDLADAADICAEPVALAAGGTEPRYSAGGMISAREAARDVITNLTAAMSALHVDRGGQIVFLPGAPRTPVMSLTDADFASDVPITYNGRRTGDELVNAISSTFVDPTNGYQEGPLPPRKILAGILEDGERFETSRGYRYVYSRTQGQRLDQIEINAARKMGRGSFGTALWGVELEPGDWIEWTSPRFGNQTKTFYVETAQFAVTADEANPQARFLFTVVETGSDVHNWSPSDEIAPGEAGVARSAPGLVLSNLAIAAATSTAGNVYFPVLDFTWDPPADPAATAVELEYRVVSTTDVFRVVCGADQSHVRVRNGVMPGQLYEVRGRLLRGDRFGPWTSYVSATTSGDISVGTFPSGYVLFDSREPGPFSVTIPGGVPAIKLRTWGAGGRGSEGSQPSKGSVTYGYGAGGGAFTQKNSHAVSAGDVISGVIGDPGDRTLANRNTTVSTPALTAGGGGDGSDLRSASGTITFSAAATPGDTITINGVTLTAHASITDATRFAVGAGAANTAANLATCINANGTTTTSAGSGGSVTTIFANTQGPGGNSITLAKSCAVATLSGSTLSGGSNAANGAGGTASGGDVNTSGNAGGLTNFWDGGAGANAGADVTTQGGAPSSPAGGSPGGAGLGVYPGAPGRVLIEVA